MGNSAWYMSLRSGYNNKNLKSAFFHIGNELSGLYCYVK